jgi:hypothetical protein
MDGGLPLAWVLVLGKRLNPARFARAFTLRATQWV